MIELKEDTSGNHEHRLIVNHLTVPVMKAPVVFFPERGVYTVTILDYDVVTAVINHQVHEFPKGVTFGFHYLMKWASEFDMLIISRREDELEPYYDVAHDFIFTFRFKYDLDWGRPYNFSEYRERLKTHLAESEGPYVITDAINEDFRIYFSVKFLNINPVAITSDEISRCILSLRNAHEKADGYLASPYYKHFIKPDTEEDGDSKIKSPKTGQRDPYRLINHVLNERYKLIEYAGGGGMGAVYRATDLTNKNFVAVKILKPDIAAKNPEYVELFEKEVGNAQKLNHPNIVQVLDHGNDDDITFMAMEWIRGNSLEDVASQEKLSIDRVVHIFEQVCRAVACAHSNNIIHLDLKPANILLLDENKQDDFVKVIDFGLSRIINKESGTTVTRFRGTHQFCAPEQFGGKVNYRSDIYSLGATLYYLIAGVIPFGSSYINAKRFPNLELPDIPSIAKQAGLPPQLDHVIRRALSRDPALRQKSVQQLFEEFNDAISLNDIDTKGDSERKQSVKEPREVPHASSLQVVDTGPRAEDIYYTARFKGDEVLARIFGSKFPEGTIWTWQGPDGQGFVQVDLSHPTADIVKLFGAIAINVGIDLNHFSVVERVMRNG